MEHACKTLICLCTINLCIQSAKGGPGAALGWPERKAERYNMTARPARTKKNAYCVSQTKSVNVKVTQTRKGSKVKWGQKHVHAVPRSKVKQKICACTKPPLRWSWSPNLRCLLWILSEKMVHTRMIRSGSLGQGQRRQKIFPCYTPINDHGHQIWERCYLNFQRNGPDKDYDLAFTFKVTGPRSKIKVGKVCPCTTTP